MGLLSAASLSSCQGVAGGPWQDPLCIRTHHTLYTTAELNYHELEQAKSGLMVNMLPRSLGGELDEYEGNQVRCVGVSE